MGGTIVQHNAEVLSTLVLQQLVRKGAPFTYASSATIMDLKTGQASGGAIEFGLFSGAMARLGHLLPGTGLGLPGACRTLKYPMPRPVMRRRPICF